MNEELTVAVEELRLHPTNKVWFLPVLMSDTPIPDRDIGAGRTLRDIQGIQLFDNWEEGVERIVRVILGGTI